MLARNQHHTHTRTLRLLAEALTLRVGYQRRPPRRHKGMSMANQLFFLKGGALLSALCIILAKTIVLPLMAKAIVGGLIPEDVYVFCSWLFYFGCNIFVIDATNSRESVPLNRISGISATLAVAILATGLSAGGLATATAWSTISACSPL